MADDDGRQLMVTVHSDGSVDIAHAPELTLAQIQAALAIAVRTALRMQVALAQAGRL